MPNEDPSNASRRRKREARKALSLSLPDKEKESVHGIIRPILSEPIPGKRKASIGLFETRLLPLSLYSDLAPVSVSVEALFEPCY